MLKIRVIVVGKDKNNWVAEGCAHFEKLLSRFAEVSWRMLPSAKAGPGLSAPEIMKREAPAIIKAFGQGLHIALDSGGACYDSKKLASELEKWLSRCEGCIEIVVGGAYGLDKSVLAQSDVVMSLSPLTFSHQIVRLVLLEQLYRAFSILHNTGYHK